MRRWFRKLRAFGGRREFDRDLQEEMRFHLDMQAAETGSPLEARRRFGNPAVYQEAIRDLWTFAPVESWWRDLRYAFRTLAGDPGFAAVAVVALALGIGANTTVFTILNGALSWNLGLDHPERMVVLNTMDASRRPLFFWSYPDFRDLRAQVKSLAGVAGYELTSVNVSDGGHLPDRFACVKMSANGFPVAEEKPMLGRDFAPEDGLPGAPPVLILAHHVWQERYGSDPTILGRTVRVNEAPMTVIGVMPAGRRFPEETDLWTPLTPDKTLEKRDHRSIMVFGRLREGGTAAAARVEVNAITQRLAGEHPEADAGLAAQVLPIVVITGAYGARPVLATLWVAVGLVLLIACVNVANLLLARGTRRAREISIRVALGAGRGRIVRQLLLESVLLALAGGLVGWWVAVGGLHWFDAGTAEVKPIWLNLSLNRSALAYLAAISAGTGILFGLVPALRLARIDVNSALKDGGRGAAGERRGLRLSGILVTIEMGLCVVLLVAAGLAIRGAAALYSAPIGVNTAGVLTMRMDIPEAKYPAAADEAGFQEALRPRLEGLPGVELADLVSNLPLGAWMPYPYELEGAATAPGPPPRLAAIVTGSHYFGIMQVRPVRGRLFTDSDGVTDPPVAIVNQSFAARFWPGEAALGKRLRLVKDRAQPWMTVVGVVPDILQNRRDGLRHDPLIYLPYAQEPQRQAYLISRTRVPPATLAETFRRAVGDLDENLAVSDVRTLDSWIAQNHLTAGVFGAILSVFAAIALLLAAVGLYSVTAHAVGQRTQEMGIRMAMGGTAGDVARLVFGQGMRPLMIGLALGLPAALAAGRVLRGILVGVKPADPVVFVAVVLVLVAAAALGCAIPARRAIRVDPAVTLRCD